MDFLGKIFKRFQLLGKPHYCFGREVIIDWLIILGIFVIGLVIFVILAFFQFDNYRHDDVTAERTSTASSTAVLLDRAKLEATVDYFAEREQKFKEIKNNQLHFADPAR